MDKSAAYPLVAYFNLIFMIPGKVKNCVNVGYDAHYLLDLFIKTGGSAFRATYFILFSILNVSVWCFTELVCFTVLWITLKPGGNSSPFAFFFKCYVWSSYILITFFSCFKSRDPKLLLKYMPFCVFSVKMLLMKFRVG